MKTSKITLKFVFALVAFALIFTPGQAQLHVASDGDVGIGVTNPSGRLHVVLDGATAAYPGYFANNITSSSTKYGVYSFVASNGTGSRYGLRSYTYAPTGKSNYGTFLVASGGNYVRGLYNYAYQPSGATSTCYGQYNYTNSYTSSSAYGNYSYMYSPSTATGSRYGIYSNVFNYGSGTTYGLYSSVNSGSGTRYAGYFNGDVHVNGDLTWTSDERTKEDVANLDGALALIDQMQPKSYKYKQGTGMNLPTGKQYGFVAQELEQVMPGLVKTIEHPAAPVDIGPIEISEEEAAGEPVEVEIAETEGETLKAVDYVALIPVLVQAIKEQQQEIEALKAQLNDK
ncbi:MAG: tail fiber domain-containing protein [Bacteroidota bacterium]